MPSTVCRVPGPCKVYYNALYLGVSKAGVNIRTRTSWAPITDDAHGTEPANFIFAGKSAQVEVVGLEYTYLKNANPWHVFGGLLANGGATGMYALMGGLASALGMPLSIVERGDVYTWQALLAVPIDPEPLLFSSTQELQIPITFLIVPDINDKLFATVPSYLI